MRLFPSLNIAESVPNRAAPLDVWNSRAAQPFVAKSLDAALVAGGQLMLTQKEGRAWLLVLIARTSHKWCSGVVE
jgi:hypothetical protein